jgi:hypothetical protein
MQENNLDFEILEFNENFISDDNLTDKIDILNQSEDSEEEDDEKELINSDLIDDENLEDLDLSEEEKEIILKKKEKESKQIKEEEDLSEEDSEDDSDEEVSPLKIFASELAEKNLLNLPEDWDGNEEALFEAYEQTLEEKANQIIKQAYKVDNPKVDGVLKFLKNGGNIDDYVATYEQSNWVDVNIEDEDNAIALVTTYLKNVKSLDDEEANALVQGYNDKGKLFTRAEEIQTELKAFREKEQQKLIDSQEEYMKQQRDQYFKTVSKIKEVIQVGKTNNVVIAKNEKNNFEDFIFTPLEIKNEKGEILGTATGFKKVLNEYLSDPEKMVALAYKLYEGLTDKSEKIETESKIKSKLADALKSKSGKVKTEKIKLEFIN